MFSAPVITISHAHQVSGVHENWCKSFRYTFSELFGLIDGRNEPFTWLPTIHVQSVNTHFFSADHVLSAQR